MLFNTALSLLKVRGVGVSHPAGRPSPPAGGAGGVSNAHLQDGAAAAAAAGGAAGGAGERHGPHPAGEAHQRAAGPHGRAAGLRLHRGQLCRPPDEDALALLLHPPPRPPLRLPVEELGRPLGIHTPSAAAPQMIGARREVFALLRRRQWCDFLSHTGSRRA